MAEVERFAAHGGLVLGICNGFQVLCEAGLLPGALLPNTSLRFECRQVELEVVGRTKWTAACEPGDRLSIPAKHQTGRYWAPDPVLDEIEANGQVVVRYVAGHAFNGAARDIAGVSQPRRQRRRADAAPRARGRPAHRLGRRPQAVRVRRARRRMSRHRELGLTDSEYDRIVELIGPRAERGRARDLQPDVVGALRLQALAQAAADAADGGPARRHGPGRERRRGRRRPRAVVRVQGRVAQPPERGRAVPGRGDRRRRDPPRRVRGRRAADRRARLAPLRRAGRLRALALPARARGRRHRPLRQLDRRRHGRRRDLLRVRLRAELPGQRDVPRADRDREADPLGGRGRRQRRRAVRRADRPRRDRRRVRAGVRGARRRRRREAPDGPDRRPVRGGEAARVLARAARRRAARRAAGPRRGRADLLVGRDGGEGRGRARPRREPRSRSARRAWSRSRS